MKFTCGAAAGALFSPLPWKLLDDAAIWTQNGTWIAQTPRGPVGTLLTTCTLCAAGCGVRLRRVGQNTVSVRGIPGHPVNGGPLCPAGLGLAQLSHHPFRVRGAVRRDHLQTNTWHPMESETAFAEVGRKLAELRASGAADRVAILDLRPGRSLSALYQSFLAEAGGGRYLTLPDGRDMAAAALAELVTAPQVMPGYDFAGAGAVISFGAPLFDGWCGAGPAPGLLPAAGSRPGGPRPHVVQVQSNGCMNSGYLTSTANTDTSSLISASPRKLARLFISEPVISLNGVLLSSSTDSSRRAAPKTSPSSFIVSGRPSEYITRRSPDSKTIDCWPNSTLSGAMPIGNPETSNMLGVEPVRWCKTGGWPALV